MRQLIATFVAVVACTMALPALAEPPKDGGDRGERPGREEMRAKMLKEFDKDGDGKLSDEERQKARETMRERRGDRERRPDGERRRGEGRDRGERRGPPPGGFEGERGPRERMHGPPIPPPGELFKKFDADSNDSLSKDEFMKLADFVKEHLPPPPSGGRRFEGRGPDGPRGEFRRRDSRGEGPPRGDGPRRDRGSRDRDDRRWERGQDRPERKGPPPGEQPSSDKDKDESDPA